MYPFHLIMKFLNHKEYVNLSQKLQTLGLLGKWCPTLALGLGEMTPEGWDGWWWSGGKEESRPQTERSGHRASPDLVGAFYQGLIC